MLLSEMVLRSKLIPPKLNQAIFHRPRLSERLNKSHAYPLTLIHAGTGFGKTTALVELGASYSRVYWYHITEPDRDPTLFLAHLISTFLPGSSSILERLAAGDLTSNSGALNALINHLTTDLEEDTILVLDDYHLVSDSAVINGWLERLVEQRPPSLHVALACRQIPETAAFVRWRVKGSVLVIDQRDLSFTQEEIQALFSEHYQYPVTPEQADTLYSYTDGWIIALQMVWQRLQNSRSRRLDNILLALPSALTDIFNFLAQEVLMRQTEPVQQFLLNTSILRQMDAAVCDALLGTSDSQAILESLLERGLFLSTADRASFRYQRLFQDFLLARRLADPERANAMHRKAADYYTRAGEDEEAIFHLLTAGDKAGAAGRINAIGQKLLEIGRGGTLTQWIEQLEPDNLNSYPTLYLLQGDALRLSSKFEEAIARYNTAERVYLQKKDSLGRSLALRSKAQVYLDTIRPLKASSLLLEAMSLLEPQEHPAQMADLLDLLAENKLNLGKPQEAQELHKEASMLRDEAVPDDIYLESRSLLRTGRLYEAVRLIESSGALVDPPAVQRPQRFHREMPLLLSLIHLMLGDVEKGEQYARQGIEIGQKLDSPFVEAVGLMRLGHACQLYPRTPWRRERTHKALAYYERAMELVRPFNVMRVQVEPLWGLCRFYGYQGSLAEARRFAQQAIDIAGTAGDYWFVALLRTSLGTAYALAGEKDLAADWLEQAAAGFSEVGDRFGQSAAECAGVLNLWLHGTRCEALTAFAQLAPRLRHYEQEFLLTRPTHLGLQDTQVYLPLLLEAQRQGIEAGWVGKILQEQALAGTDFHPGYGLNVRSLGAFDIWRGSEPNPVRDWQRDKARQLAQLLLVTGRGKWLTREQISDRLWPELDPESASQNLKVVMNALNHALEPKRQAGVKPFFITRREALYGLNPAACIHIDTDDFLALAASNHKDDLLEALSIYAGDYLEDGGKDHTAGDDPTARATRDQLRETYFEAALRLAEIYYQEENWGEAIKTCHEILTRDLCCEPAFQVLMRAHAARGNRSAVHAVYQRCVKSLREELDVAPSAETTQVWGKLTE